MRIFEIIFVTLSRIYIKVWRKYTYWAMGVRYFMFLMLFFNYFSVVFCVDMIHTKEVFIGLLLFGYFFISFYKPSINNKEFVENYPLTKNQRIAVLSYVILSIILVIFLFLIKIVYGNE